MEVSIVDRKLKELLGITVAYWLPIGEPINIPLSGIKLVVLIVIIN
jgi:hypothetical protein